MSRLAWVDVFAARPMAGNPLAVVLEAEGWSDERMQRFAAELGISETTFVLPADGAAAARVRIFTPTRELPMAGHPIVGTAWVLRATGAIAERAELETRAGILRVHVRGQVATMDQAPPQAGPLVDPEEIGAALGAVPLADPAPRVWSTGVPQLMVHVPMAALPDRRPDSRAIVALGERDGWVGVSAYALPDEPGDPLLVRVRHFAPGAGVPEDPVTGSAAGALGACLTAAGVGPRDGDLRMIVRQGDELGRPGEVAVRVRTAGGEPQRVRVGGRVVPLFEGRLVGDGLAAGVDGGR